ncbi:hypothetical protein N7471_010915 [Penicillium samsonianum]|uniref:uncharacterized protein n=1 Tax=Penicillium samsonianum TaxID=1882272 RepID=UPI002549A036|nr:uncharacterized protein N7471_010915 [Penicillium samsonianum]KAJ6123598.1 hypothetical protein N7471_010915 [Penicillium samsonianum]
MQTMLEHDIKNYTDIMADGYNSKFKIYSKAVVEGAPEIIHDFYMDYGTDYFSCIVIEWQPWCGPCEVQYGTTAAQCRYCTLYKDEMGYLNVSEPYPPDTLLHGST